MEVKFDVIKPNLYLVDDRIYFGIDSSDIIPISRAIDEIIEKHIETLKVTESDLESVETGRKSKCKCTEDYTVPLARYLDAIKKYERYRLGEFGGITNSYARLFGLDYVVNAVTLENLRDRDIWRQLQKDLYDPEKTFDTLDKGSLVYRLDREKTLEEMKKLNRELEPKIPDNYASLTMFNGKVPYSEREFKLQNLVLIGLYQLKAKDKTKIEEAKIELVEELKKVDGPCLSFDAPEIVRQILRLYKNAPGLVQKYGDVLKSPMWQTRLFRLDP